MAMLDRKLFFVLLFKIYITNKNSRTRKKIFLKTDQINSAYINLFTVNTWLMFVQGLAKEVTKCASLRQIFKRDQSRQNTKFQNTSFLQGKADNSIHFRPTFIDFSLSKMFQQIQWKKRSDSEVLSSEKKKLTTTTITRSPCLSKLQNLRINYFNKSKLIKITI